MQNVQMWKFIYVILFFNFFTTQILKNTNKYMNK